MAETEKTEFPRVLFSSKSEEYLTPYYDVFKPLDYEFSFDCDPCTTPFNPLGLRYYYTKMDDGLIQPWHKRNFINPPYGRNISMWLLKAHAEIYAQRADVCVFLLPSRTGTQWFHKWLYRRDNVELRFWEGRIRFGNAEGPAPFDSLVAIIRREINGRQ